MTFLFVFILANRFMRWYHHSIELISLREEQLYKDLNTGLYNRNKLIQDSTEVLYPSIIVFRMKGLNLLNNIYFIEGLNKKVRVREDSFGFV